jgi:gamma-glutamyltranspeptidase/glutathione hydrolase
MSREIGVMRNFHVPGRSPVYATHAMCATSHPIASLTAIEVLRKGGNAVDAAIATAAVLAVLEPQMTGIGGDCFAMLAKPGQRKLIALNASGRTPAAATCQWYAKAGMREINAQSPHAITVPGAVDGWARLLADHGTMTMAELLAPAIELAERGVAVAPRVAWDWARAESKIRCNEAASRHLLVNGRAPDAGEVVRFKALARTLRSIAEGGRDAFYEGEIAVDMVKELRRLGGLHTLEDFAAQRSSYVTPISVPYKGIELFELPPNNHGIVALILLKLLEKIGRSGKNPASAERYHVMMEAARLAYAVRDMFVADPATADVPVMHMLSDGLIGDLAKRISKSKRVDALGSIPQPTGSETVCFSIVDERGMAISFINSLFADFGSALATKRTGIVFHNRATGFTLDPRHPNAIGPRKRPMHTLAPAMVFNKAQPWLSFGVMGAAFQPMGHVYLLTNIVDYGLDPQEAIDHPRVFFEGDRLEVEWSLPAPTVQRLKDMGHSVAVRETPWGGGQLVVMDRANGVLIGASDGRKDGLALGY